MVTKMVGTCPKCGSDCVSYGAVQLVDEQLYYPTTCDDCGCGFKEWYKLNYIESITNDNLDEVT